MYYRRMSGIDFTIFLYEIRVLMIIIYSKVDRRRDEEMVEEGESESE